MNRIRKGVTVRFFSIKANHSFLGDLKSTLRSNQTTENSVRILNIREKKYLINIHPGFRHKGANIFYILVVRERNTWQTRALRSGEITGISRKQGVIGDPYYLMFVPKYNYILGFTTGLYGSLKSVATITLQQFNKQRTRRVMLEHLSKEKEFRKLRELIGYHRLHFKISASSIREPNDGAPSILRELSTAPFIANNSQIALTFDEIGDKGFTEKDVLDIVDYLAENDGCSALTVQGTDADGVKVHLDFGRAYIVYKTQIELRQNYINKDEARDILIKALDSFDPSSIKGE